MSERFSDEVLQRVHEAGERAYIGIKHELLDDWQAIDAARFAAMRAVLEAASETCTFCEHLLAAHDAYGCQARRCDCMPESVRV